jgi:hypothetical protein
MSRVSIKDFSSCKSHVGRRSVVLYSGLVPVSRAKQSESRRLWDLVLVTNIISQP